LALLACSLLVGACNGREHAETSDANHAYEAGLDASGGGVDAREGAEREDEPSLDAALNDGIPDGVADQAEDAQAGEAPDRVVDTSDADASDGVTVDAVGDVRAVDALDATDSADGPATTPKVFGSPCRTDDECMQIGAGYYCLKMFQNAAIVGGLCTRMCPGASADCGPMGACISEIGAIGDNLIQACLPTCKLDVPCRSGFTCQFVYKDNMLVEPSICAPDGAH